MNNQTPFNYCTNQKKFYDVCKLYNISDNMIGDLLREFATTPDIEDMVASPKILQVIDGGKHE